ncbi:MAG: MBL fold metallo-hydrolase [Haloechinothrix sp.]
MVESTSAPTAVSRRTLLAAGGLAAGGLALGAATPVRARAATTGSLPEGRGAAVVTLGTGAGPTLRTGRVGIATGIVVDQNMYLVDCGLGVTKAVVDSGLPTRNLQAVLLTHLHSDHIGELPAFVLWNWGPPTPGPQHPYRIIGPASARVLPHGYRPVIVPPTPGTEDTVRNMLQAYAYDINIRVNDENRPPLNDLLEVSDIGLPAGTGAHARGDLAPEMDPFVVYEDDAVRISAALVYHPPIFPAFGYRIETEYGVVALSGDTAEHANVVRLAHGADLLVHESVNLEYYRQRDFDPVFINHLAESHTTPQEVGTVATKAGVDHVVLSHLAGVATDEEWAAWVRETYAGRVTVAADGQVFALGR